MFWGFIRLPASRVCSSFVFCLTWQKTIMCRTHFVHTSVTHLLSTTYAPMDALRVSALLAYLNAAMPPDKHEEFDTAEVARAVGALAGRGRVVFEGDVLRVTGGGV